MNININEFVKLNEFPQEGFREVKWNVNENYDHHTLTLKDGYGNTLTLFNDELDKLYDYLGSVLFYKG
ncbi:hypothetical protein [Peribacillus loiseleuriae]|uniref:Uncharacterized protein n=1 Tax=Peribacillus loiseleuriae TaxID=1679170 RepID=A0A0K9GSL8_9BACI|nr:hypothetical protein [Peribacillus loiseleuriae]KMY49606.1 hypothetical protein AC625_08665 [Peribacillus loiseleuriae]